MGFKAWLKEAMKSKALFKVVGGQNYFNPASSNLYQMVSEEETYGEGVVQIQDKLYYYLGSYKEQAHTRSGGKAAAGAIIGGALTGGVGAVIGAAIGGRKKDDSLFWIEFADYETKQRFSVQVKPHKSSPYSISDFKPVNPVDIGLE